MSRFSKLSRMLKDDMRDTKKLHKELLDFFEGDHKLFKRMYIYSQSRSTILNDGFLLRDSVRQIRLISKKFGERPPLEINAGRYTIKRITDARAFLSYVHRFKNCLREGFFSDSDFLIVYKGEAIIGMLRHQDNKWDGYYAIDNKPFQLDLFETLGNALEQQYEELGWENKEI